MLGDVRSGKSHGARVAEARQPAIVTARTRGPVMQRASLPAATDSFHTLKLIGAGALQELEGAGMMAVDFVTSIAKFREHRGFAVTRRGILTYLANFRLTADALIGKTILDLGTGRSRFVQTVNAQLADKGTFAVGVDLFAKPPGAGAYPFVTADAFKLPFRDGAFDLVLSNWFFCLFMPDMTSPRFTTDKKQKLDALVDQIVPLLAAGGEARVSFSLLHVGLGGVSYVRDRFRAHPDIALCEVKGPLPWMGCIRAVRRA